MPAQPNAGQPLQRAWRQQLQEQQASVALRIAKPDDFDTVIDVGLAHPATHRLGRDVEVGRDLVDRQVTRTSDSDDVALELRRELPRREDILSEGPRPSQEMSARAAASPRPAAGLAFAMPSLVS
jgi:hypothetical protein